MISVNQVHVREIQALGRSEAISLSQIWSQLNPSDKVTAAQFNGDVAGLLSGGGRAWIMQTGGTIAGYATLAPTPGLPGLYELDGFVAPACQRQGLGSFLLKSMVGQLGNSAVQQLFYSVPSMNSPAAHFLMKNGFYVEHEERYLTLRHLQSLSEARLGERYSLKTLGQRRAITTFRLLYETAFAGLPWYQPYESDLEVARDLPDPDDLLFLTDQGRPIGFLWLRWPEQRLAEIEPVGLLPSYRGQGLGRQLLLSGLARAARQGAEQARVGVWRQNTAALALYESLGFRVSNRRYFLAYTV